MPRTNYCGLITEEYLNQEVTIEGWVQRFRDLGPLKFIDLRDREGIIQIVIDTSDKNIAYINNYTEDNKFNIKHESVLQIKGIVRNRVSPNLELKTGFIEVAASYIKVINTSTSLPIMIDDNNTSETNRMLHRIIDLRGQKMQHNLRLRHKVVMSFRHFLDSNGFIDIETPFLTRSTPGGARDFLVPSSAHKGQFYALPQSPQLFKQLLMVAGFDRYYQVVKCFRDEDFRADRQLEFTQVDIETSFLDESSIRDVAEKMLVGIFKEVLDVDLPKFPVISYLEAINKYGSDKPDLRIPLHIIDLTQQLTNSTFQAFYEAANNTPHGKIGVLKLPQEAALSRKELDNYSELITAYNAKGLAYIKINDISKTDSSGFTSPIAKFLSATEIKDIFNTTNASNGETILFVADSDHIVNEALGALRLKIAQDKNLITNSWMPLWVIDFPLFEYDQKTKRYVSCHHPFTAPRDQDVELLKTHPNHCLAKAYDLVLNGWEIAGGSIRIHQQELQQLIFDIMTISKQEAQDKFGFLLDNLQYGAPPHGGIAFGLDRLVAMMCKAESIRDVIAFPKTTTGQCLLTNAPSTIDKAQLDLMGINVDTNNVKSIKS